MSPTNWYRISPKAELTVCGLYNLFQFLNDLLGWTFNDDRLLQWKSIQRAYPFISGYWFRKKGVFRVQYVFSFSFFLVLDANCRTGKDAGATKRWRDAFVDFARRISIDPCNPESWYSVDFYALHRDKVRH